MKCPRSFILALVFLLILGTALRLYQLGFNCYWTEELYTALLSLKSPAEIYFGVLSSEFNPPGFYLIEWVSRNLFGYNEIAFRVPSVIAGILLIPAMYYVGKEFKDDVTGLFCAGFVTVSYPMFYYSQFARAYSLSFLLFALAFLYYLRLRKGDNHLSNYLLFGAFVGLSAWTHFFSLIPLSMLWIILLLRDKSRKRVMQSLGVAALISLPLLPMIVTFIRGRVFSSPESLPYGEKALTLIQIFPVEFFSSTFMIFAVLILMGLFVERHRIDVWEFMSVGVITVIMGLLLSPITPIYIRYMLPVLIFLFLISASFISEILKGKSERVVVVVLLVFTFLLLAVQAPDFIAHYTVQQYVCTSLPRLIAIP